MMKRIVALSLAALVAGPAAAQSGAFNMGQLTGTLSQDAVTQSEARRGHDGGGRGVGAGSDRVKSLCAQRFAYSAAERASEDGREVERMCRAKGF